MSPAEHEVVEQLAEGGWDRSSVVLAILAGWDWTLLRHTGKVRIRLDPPAPLSGKG